jgi:hypothetical protein
MFGVYTKAIMSALAALAALISAATAYYANNGNGGILGQAPAAAQEFQQTRVHGAPGPEMGIGVLPALAAGYGLYLVARRRRKQH